MKLTHYIILIPFSFLTSFSRLTMNAVAKREYATTHCNELALCDALVLSGTHETSMWDNAQG